MRRKCCVAQIPAILTVPGVVRLPVNCLCFLYTISVSSSYLLRPLFDRYRTSIEANTKKVRRRLEERPKKLAVFYIVNGEACTVLKNLTRLRFLNKNISRHSRRNGNIHHLQNRRSDIAQLSSFHCSFPLIINYKQRNKVERMRRIR